jgi:predicted transcriptional regulator
MQGIKLVVYNWASENTSEREVSSKFYPTKFFDLLCFRLRNTDRSLIGICGLQGTGKTKILYQLSSLFKESLYWKWTRHWEEDALLWDVIRSDYSDRIHAEGEDVLHENARLGLKKELVNKLSRNVENFSDLDESVIQRILGKGRMEEIKKEVLLDFFKQQTLLLIDFPDYSKGNVGFMNSDIDELQRFLELLANRGIHVVIGVQRELVMFHRHFFWGKVDIMTLDPLAPEELVKAYHFCTGNNTIFTDEALLLLAQLARGVFRRFKKYIKFAIESSPDSTQPLGLEQVNKAITQKQLFEDIELELCDIFAESEKRIQASNILNFLRANKDVNLKTIAEGVNLSETIAQKIIWKLDLYHYVTVKHGEGKEKLISLKL